jgi:hypothetical protein
MASSIGSAASRQATVRPVLTRVTSPASESTSRCFITAGSDIACGRASSDTDTLSASASRATIARRVGSASAAKVRSRTGCGYLTMGLSIAQSGALVKSRSGAVILAERSESRDLHPRAGAMDPG